MWAKALFDFTLFLHLGRAQETTAIFLGFFMTVPAKSTVVSLASVGKPPKVDTAVVPDTMPFSIGLAHQVGVCGALLVQRIHFWTLLNRNIRAGHSWVYRTYEELATDLGGLFDTSTIKRALSKLKTVGVLIVGKGMNKAGYDKTNWYRIDKQVALKLSKDLPIIGSKCTVPSGQNDPINQVKKNRPIQIIKESIEEEHKTQIASDSQVQTSLNIPEGFKEENLKTEFKEEKEKTEEKEDKDQIPVEDQNPPTPLKGETVNAEEILNKFKTEAKSLTVKTTSTGVNALALAWKKAVALEVGGYAKPLTGKEMGQLQHVHKALGEAALPCLYHALGNWESFALEASTQAGCNPAMSPNTGFFCQHYAVALNSMNKPKSTKGKAVVIVQSIALSQAPCSSVQTEVCDNQHHEPKATTNDVKAALAALAAVVATNGNT